MEQAFYRFGDKSQLAFIAPGTREYNRVLSGYVYISAPDSLTHLRDIEPSRLSIPMVARKPFRQILERREEREISAGRSVPCPRGRWPRRPG